MNWYEVCVVVPGTDGDAENGPCEPLWYKYMVSASSKEEATRIANEQEEKDWQEPMTNEDGAEIGPSAKEMGQECPVCEWAREATEEEYLKWKADQDKLEEAWKDAPFN